MSREILDCLKRERDICVKNVIHSQNTAFMFTPALNPESAEETFFNHASVICLAKLTAVFVYNACI